MDINCITEKSNIKEAIALLERVEKKLLVVCDSEKKVIGTISDGDIRRGILKSVNCNDCVSAVMNTKPVLMHEEVHDDLLIEKMDSLNIFYVPVVCDNGMFIRLSSLEDLKEGIYDNYSVFILAGGLGSRLKDLTKNTPKPMLHIHDKPMLERLIIDFRNQGIRKFYISVNYLKDVIMNYFGNGSYHDVDIVYVEEDKRLGTAGPLSMLPDSFVARGLIVINADVCVKSDFRAILRYHHNSYNKMTVCAKEKRQEIPYGVVRFEDDSLISIDEKPVTSYFINAGIYVIERELLAELKRNEYLDMPDFINHVKDSNNKVGIYPLHEEWEDIGLPSQYEKFNAAN